MEDPAENFKTGLKSSGEGETRNVKNGSLRLKASEVFLGPTVDDETIELGENESFLSDIEDAEKCIDETQDGGTSDALSGNMAGYNAVSLSGSENFFLSSSEFASATRGNDRVRDNATDNNAKRVDEWLKETKAAEGSADISVEANSDAKTSAMNDEDLALPGVKPFLEGDPATVTIKEGTGEHLELLIKTRTGEQVFRIKSNITLDGLQPLMLQQVLSEQIINGGAPALNNKEGQPEKQTVDGACADEEDSNSKCEESTEISITKPLQMEGSLLYENICEALGRKKNKIFPCPVEECSQVFSKECKLKIHLMSHEETRPFKCEGCDWSFTSFYRLKRHLLTHIGRKDYVCGEPGCNSRFTTVYNLNTHRELHKRRNSFACSTPGCDKTFSTHRKMELHLKDHTDVEAPYKCPLASCGKSYYSANFLASHLRVHQYSLDDLKCPVVECGKCFTRLCHLRQHLRMHTGERPYLCDHPGCGWAFSSASKLTRHTRKHTGDRRYVCPEVGCGKSFMRPEHLKGHIVIHSGVRPFHCPHPNCKISFTAKSSLYVHLKKHKGETQKTVYPCPISSCTKTYSCKPSLRHHLMKVHASELGNGNEESVALTHGQDSDGMESMEDTTQDVTTIPISVITNGGDTLVELPETTVIDSSALLLHDSTYCASNTYTTTQFLTSTGTVSGDLLSAQLASMSTAQLIVTPDFFAGTPADRQWSFDTKQEVHSEVPGTGPNPSESDGQFGTPATVDGVLTESRKSILSSQELDLIPRNLPDSTGGSARTDYCSNLILSSRAKRRRILQQQFKMKEDAMCLDSSRKQELNSMAESGILSSADVVLSSAIALPEPSLANQFTHSQLLQDDPPTSDIYHEDHLLNAELPVPLLVESSVNVSVGEFAGSTINLQDLE